MLRISKLTDYGIVILVHMARDEEAIHNARDVASTSDVPLPTVSKVLKMLGGAGLLVSHRGVKGGWSFARPSTKISVAEIITAIEGPIALTECSTDCPGQCDLEPVCPVRNNWRKINHVIRNALENLSLFHMARELPRQPPPRSKEGFSRLVVVSGKKRSA